MDSGQTTQADERKKAIEQLVGQIYNAVEDHIIADRILDHKDAYLIFGKLYDFLSAYTGELNASDFLEWALDVLESHIFVCSLKKQYELFVLKAFWKILKDCPEFIEYAHIPGKEPRCITTEELSAELWFWCLQNSHELRVPGTAKTSTRLCARAKWIARAWKTNRIRARKNSSKLPSTDPFQFVRPVEPGKSCLDRKNPFPLSQKNVA